MSVQSARDFIKKVEADQTLQERLEAAADLEARQRLVREAGFDFTLEEFSQAAQEVAAARGQEMSPEELEGVAGGAGKVGWCPFHGWCNKGCSNHGLVA